LNEPTTLTRPGGAPMGRLNVTRFEPARLLLILITRRWPFHGTVRRACSTLSAPMIAHL
jgi:hypothetical protein